MTTSILIQSFTKPELLAIKERFSKDPKNTRFGICSNYIHFNRSLTNRILRELMVECCKDLGIYSGSVGFPIKSPYEHESHDNIYYTNIKWSKRYKYGKWRWALLNKMREEIDKAIEAK